MSVFDLLDDVAAQDQLQRRFDEEGLEWIKQHPTATPKEVCEAFGIPFDRRMYEQIVRQHPRELERLAQDPAGNAAWLPRQ